MKKLFSLVALTAAAATTAFADDAYSARVDDHAPIGVMADHFHNQGEMMASLRFMHMEMGDPVNEMMGPQSMHKQMYMAGFMYAPSDKVTFAAMANFSDASMDMIMMGNEMEMTASDFGDIRLSAIVPLHVEEHQRFHITLGTSIPTGATDAVNAMDSRLGLNMQSGTGSWGFTPSATYSLFFENWSLGLQASGQFWLDDNDFGERMGDRIEFTGWTALQVNDHVSFSARLAYRDQGAISGTMMANMSDGREMLRAFGGINTVFHGHRFAIEAGAPLWQDRGANALGAGFMLMAGWQKSF